LSKKSIERRKSERSFQDAWSSAASSATTSPYLVGAVSGQGIPDVPELPPLTSDMFENPAGFKPQNKTIKKKKSLVLKRKSANATSTQEVPNPAETFASIPYEATQKMNEETKEEDHLGKSPPKRRLSKALSRVFSKPSNSQEGNTKPKSATSIKKEALDTTNDNDVKGILESKPISPPTTENHKEETKQSQQQQGGHLVSLIAQRLRVNSVDEDGSESVECECSKCSGNKESSAVCRRLSMMMMEDDERRRSFELRRRRGASIDIDHHE
jgi:hypothetical protein